MNIFVMVDMEGISGILNTCQVSPDKPEYNRARQFLTADVNACVEGCFEGGARRVVVRDAHSSGFNFLWEQLDPRAEYVQGHSRERMPGLAGFDGLILLGYHAMAGTPCAVLEHTMSSRWWQHCWINGKRVGEIAIDAGVAGDHGVPTIMVSGDDKACREARQWVRGIHAAVVKQGLEIEGAILLSTETARALITETAARAVRGCRKIRPLKFKSPVKMRLELVSRGAVPVQCPWVKVIDGRTYEVSGRDVETALNMVG